MRDAYHVRAFSTKVKNEWNYTSIFSVFVACTGGSFTLTRLKTVRCL